ncbi:uncharacterized protein PSANT_01297 [Moesziomyces antarcticus]|uniref:Uncharacterized protein n=1 Tax=Pseudozyma antarctica TaxID=84753 RepID=A0A5C3FGS1_PSEA2|nr:uncharacterized protein PSANT_01297 [Moesziomyces antarcticus]
MINSKPPTLEPAKFRHPARDSSSTLGYDLIKVLDLHTSHTAQSAFLHMRSNHLCEQSTAEGHTEAGSSPKRPNLHSPQRVCFPTKSNSKSASTTAKGSHSRHMCLSYILCGIASKINPPPPPPPPPRYHILCEKPNCFRPRKKKSGCSCVVRHKMRNTSGKQLLKAQGCRLNSTSSLMPTSPISHTDTTKDLTWEEEKVCLLVRLD